MLAPLFSDSEQKMEGEMLKLLQQTKQAGGFASLTFTIRDRKMKAKLEVELDPPAPASPGSTPPLPATAPAPGGGRHRRKGAAAKAKAKTRAALPHCLFSAKINERHEEDFGYHFMSNFSVSQNQIRQ